MLENRNLRLDLFALALLVLVAFLGVALVTYSPADRVGELTPPLNSIYQADALVYPAADKTGNACGRLGALVADVLLNALGLGAYYFVVSLATVNIVLLRRRKVSMPALRAVGWVASLAGVTTILALGIPDLSVGPVIGSGGYLGTLLGGLMKMHFAVPGGLILSAALLLGGLLLCTDYTLIRISGRILRIVFSGASAAKPRRRKRETTDDAAKTTKIATDDLVEESADEEEDDEDEVVSIRIRGKRPIEDEPADDVAAESNAEQEVAAAKAEVVEQEPVMIKKNSLEKKSAVKSKPHFRIRRKPEHDRDEVMTQLDEAVRQDETSNYELPSIDLLLEGDDVCFDEQEKEVRRKAKILEKTFAEFGFDVRVVEIETGPVIAQYEVQLQAGLRLSKITGLADDLAIALRVPSVRIVAPIPGKNTVGIEVPNETRQVVRLRDVMEETNGKANKMRIPIFLGKDVSGKPMAVDLSTLPHLLIAGRTGTGKSVCLNAIISSILMTRRPDEVRMLMIDPKMVELSGYGRLPHLMHPVVTDMRKAEAILAWAVEKMEERYALLAKAGVRHISSYNQLGEEELMERLEPEDDEQRQAIPVHLPFIVIVADEIADLMMTAGKDVEQHIIRLAQKSRAVGIHLILATQKPTVDVITGLIKSNLPARIAFQVASRTDSRVVLDEMGADKLLGNGDMLFLWPGTSTLLRGQGTYLSDDEIDAVTEAASKGEQNFVNELVNLKVEEDGQTEQPGQLKQRDDLYESAVDIVVREGRGSVSLLQRSLGIGYGRAARLIDFMAEDNIVGQYAGSQARDVLISLADWERMQGMEPEEEEAAATAPASGPPKKRRSNKIRPEPEPEYDEQAADDGDDWEDEDDGEDAEYEYEEYAEDEEEELEAERA